MSMQSVVLRNRRLTNAVMSRLPSRSHDRRGEKCALHVARTALSRTAAYPNYLRSKGYSVTSIADMDVFRRLPILDKKNYVDHYSLPDLCLDGRLSEAYTIEKSSGHSGGSYYWLRLAEEDALFPQYIEHAFAQFYGIGTKSTLVLITLALGTWTSGEKMAQALRETAAKGKYALTVMTPGTDLEEVLDIVSDLSPLYDQTVVVGYPPFVKTVVDGGIRRGFDWPSLGVKLGLGGEGYSEQWRDHMAAAVGVDSRIDLLGVSGGYGAADIGMSIGREYPATVMIRKMCLDDPALAESLFVDVRGNHRSLPSLLQYNPATSYIEEVDNELVFTVLSGIPLVRYNIHDHGGVVPFDIMMQTLQKHGHDLLGSLQSIGYGREELWQLPFFFVFGRADGTVTITGANVFPENIQAVLDEADDHDIVTFKLEVQMTSDFGQRLVISLEHSAASLAEDEKATLSARYHSLLVEGLRKANADFRFAHDNNPRATDPIVRVHEKGSEPFADQSGIKHKYTN